MHGRAIVFDLDGTLIDSRHDLAAALNVVRMDQGLAAAPLAEVMGWVGDGLALLLERGLVGLAHPDRERAQRLFADHYQRHCCDHTRPYDGVDAVLRDLSRRGWDLAVVSNKPLAFTRCIVDHLGWRDLLRAVVGGEGIRKPDPAPIHQVLAVLGAAPAASWVVGDHRTDCDAGRAAGCRVAFCTWGIGRREGRPVDAELTAISELPGLVGSGDG